MAIICIPRKNKLEEKILERERKLNPNLTDSEILKKREDEQNKNKDLAKANDEKEYYENFMDNLKNNVMNKISNEEYLTYFKNKADKEKFLSLKSVIFKEDWNFREQFDPENLRYKKGENGMEVLRDAIFRNREIVDRGVVRDMANLLDMKVPNLSEIFGDYRGLTEIPRTAEEIINFRTEANKREEEMIFNKQQEDLKRKQEAKDSVLKNWGYAEDVIQAREFVKEDTRKSDLILKDYKSDVQLSDIHTTDEKTKATDAKLLTVVKVVDPKNIDILGSLVKTKENIKFLIENDIATPIKKGVVDQIINADGEDFKMIISGVKLKDLFKLTPRYENFKLDNNTFIDSTRRNAINATRNSLDGSAKSISWRDKERSKIRASGNVSNLIEKILSKDTDGKYGYVINAVKNSFDRVLLNDGSVYYTDKNGSQIGVKDITKLLENTIIRNSGRFEEKEIKVVKHIDDINSSKLLSKGNKEEWDKFMNVFGIQEEVSSLIGDIKKHGEELTSYSTILSKRKFEDVNKKEVEDIYGMFLEGENKINDAKIKNIFIDASDVFNNIDTENISSFAKAIESYAKLSNNNIGYIDAFNQSKYILNESINEMNESGIDLFLHTDYQNKKIYLSWIKDSRKIKLKGDSDASGFNNNTMVLGSWDIENKDFNIVQSTFDTYSKFNILKKHMSKEEFSKLKVDVMLKTVGEKFNQSSAHYAEKTKELNNLRKSQMRLVNAIESIDKNAISKESEWIPKEGYDIQDLAYVNRDIKEAINVLGINEKTELSNVSKRKELRKNKAFKTIVISDSPLGRRLELVNDQTQGRDKTNKNVLSVWVNKDEKGYRVVMSSNDGGITKPVYITEDDERYSDIQKIHQLSYSNAYNVGRDNLNMDMISKKEELQRKERMRTVKLYIDSNYSNKFMDMLEKSPINKSNADYMERTKDLAYDSMKISIDTNREFSRFAGSKINTSKFNKIPINENKKTNEFSLEKGKLIIDKETGKYVWNKDFIPETRKETKYKEVEARLFEEELLEKVYKNERIKDGKTMIKMLQNASYFFTGKENNLHNILEDVNVVNDYIQATLPIHGENKTEILKTLKENGFDLITNKEINPINFDKKWFFEKSKPIKERMNLLDEKLNSLNNQSDPLDERFDEIKKELSKTQDVNKISKLLSEQKEIKQKLNKISNESENTLSEINDLKSKLHKIASTGNEHRSKWEIYWFNRMKNDNPNWYQRNSRTFLYEGKESEERQIARFVANVESEENEMWNGIPEDIRPEKDFSEIDDKTKFEIGKEVFDRVASGELSQSDISEDFIEAFLEYSTFNAEQNLDEESENVLTTSEDLEERIGVNAEQVSEREGGDVKNIYDFTPDDTYNFGQIIQQMDAMTYREPYSERIKLDEKQLQKSYESSEIAKEINSVDGIIASGKKRVSVNSELGERIMRAFSKNSDFIMNTLQDEYLKNQQERIEDVMTSTDPAVKLIEEARKTKKYPTCIS